MQALLSPASSPPLPAPDSHWQDWVTYGLRWASLIERAPALEPHKTATRTLTLHAYREPQPGPRWRALYDATWPAYRRWYTREGLDARPPGRVPARSCRIPPRAGAYLGTAAPPEW